MQGLLHITEILSYSKWVLWITDASLGIILIVKAYVLHFQYVVVIIIFNENILEIFTYIYIINWWKQHLPRGRWFAITNITIILSNSGTKITKIKTWLLVHLKCSHIQIYPLYYTWIQTFIETIKIKNGFLNSSWIPMKH